jgi:uncharacterized coiled-coil protein SlyX
LNKVWKLEKKKAQYEDRIRALEARIVKMQELVAGQDDYIRYLVRELELATGKDIIKVPSTTHKPYQQPSSQTQTLPQSPVGTETNPESSYPRSEILEGHMGLAPEQST